MSARYLIIGGAPKSGTTSLFRYLADHPEVAPARVKEPGFFMDPDAVTEPPAAGLAAALGDRAREAYEGLFLRRDLPVRLEATVGYLYSPGTPRRIAETLPGAVDLVFVLRHPVDRFLSAFHYIRQLHGEAAQGSLRAFIEHQARTYDAPTRRQLVEGNYATLVARYLGVFSRERIHLVSHAELAERPGAVARRLCERVGVDPSFYDAYGFERENVTRGHRSPALDKLYRRVMLPLRERALRYPRLFDVLHRVNRRTLDRLYHRANARSEDRDPVPDADRAWLEAYYADEVRELAALTGRDDLLRRHG